MAREESAGEESAGEETKIKGAANGLEWPGQKRPRDVRDLLMLKKRARTQPLYTPPRKSGPSLSAAAMGALAICLVTVAALLFISLEEHDKSIEQRAAAVESSPTPAAASSNTATPFVDGQIQFLVQSIQPFGAPPAQGELIQVVEVRLANMGSSPQLVRFNDQRLLGDQGREFPPDSVLLMELNNGKEAVLLPPGGNATVWIPFVLPIGTEPVAVEFHAGPQIGGVALPSN